MAASLSERREVSRAFGENGEFFVVAKSKPKASIFQKGSSLIRRAVGKTVEATKGHVRKAKNTLARNDIYLAGISIAAVGAYATHALSSGELDPIKGWNSFNDLLSLYVPQMDPVAVLNPFDGDYVQPTTELSIYAGAGLIASEEIRRSRHPQRSFEKKARAMHAARDDHVKPTEALLPPEYVARHSKELIRGRALVKIEPQNGFDDGHKRLFYARPDERLRGTNKVVTSQYDGVVKIAPASPHEPGFSRRWKYKASVKGDGPAVVEREDKSGNITYSIVHGSDVPKGLTEDARTIHVIPMNQEFWTHGEKLAIKLNGFAERLMPRPRKTTMSESAERAELERWEYFFDRCGMYASSPRGG
ncbi:MAG: hypothetical protein HYS81_01740 [Candidatus Aenigmatarchaeota archaeon]|nr:MAG: hypothetical protein HYS81_01740 [Candidatus Aenigmarchaeota archaeon]